MKFICVLLLFTCFKSYAQYPFEKYPIKKYDSVKFEVVQVNDSTVMDVAKYKNYTIKLLESQDNGGTILLYLKNKLIKKIDGDFSQLTYVIKPLYIEDVNNDGKFDFLIETYYGGCGGLACSNISNTYLINAGNNNFHTVNYGDFYDKAQLEYEFNNDGNFEIIGESLAYYKGHNYWLFDLYTFKNGKFVNVSKKYNYPIAIPYLYKETYIVTHKIPKSELMKLSLNKPMFFAKD